MAQGKILPGVRLTFGKSEGSFLYRCGRLGLILGVQAVKNGFLTIPHEVEGLEFVRGKDSAWRPIMIKCKKCFFISPVWFLIYGKGWNPAGAD
jgi:hypothetical protein